MPRYSPTTPAPAAGPDALHPRNRHRGRYDFARLAQATPELAAFLAPNPHEPLVLALDFANPAAVRALNRALLRQFYGIQHWDLPAGYLCPPIPGRADYLHYLADLLATTNAGVVPTGKRIKVLDVGVGASCIYPIIGHHDYGWRFVGSDTDAVALRMAHQIVASNPGLTGAVELRRQPDSAAIFAGIVGPTEEFDLTVCNPPFHASAAEAAAATRRKAHNLGPGPAAHSAPNFGGQPTELWYPGGEATFLWRMATESAGLGARCGWFTALVSKKETLPGLHKSLQKLGATDVRTIAMSQGHKASRLVAWTFLDAGQQQAWQQRRWVRAVD